MRGCGTGRDGGAGRPAPRRAHWAATRAARCPAAGAGGRAAPAGARYRSSTSRVSTPRQGPRCSGDGRTPRWGPVVAIAVRTAGEPRSAHAGQAAAAGAGVPVHRRAAAAGRPGRTMAHVDARTEPSAKTHEVLRWGLCMSGHLYGADGSVPGCSAPDEPSLRQPGRCSREGFVAGPWAPGRVTRCLASGCAERRPGVSSRPRWPPVPAREAHAAQPEVAAWHSRPSRLGSGSGLPLHSRSEVLRAPNRSRATAAAAAASPAAA